MKEACCLPEVRKGLIENSKGTITAVHFKEAGIVSFSGNKQVGDIKTGQAITVYYNRQMKSGELRPSTRNSFVTHRFCPFCGKKYE